MQRGEILWKKLRATKVLVDHTGQPLAMFKFACHKMGLAFDAIDAVDVGNAAKIDAAFRAGEGVRSSFLLLVALGTRH